MSSAQGDLISGTIEFARVAIEDTKGLITYSLVKIFKGRISDASLLNLQDPKLYIGGRVF
jgi:hypothetical protein